MNIYCIVSTTDTVLLRVRFVARASVHQGISAPDEPLPSRCTEYPKKQREQSSWVRDTGHGLVMCVKGLSLSPLREAGRKERKALVLVLVLVVDGEKAPQADGTFLTSGTNLNLRLSVSS